VQQISPNLLLELIKSSLLSSDFISIIKPHLDYSFIPNEEYKEIFKYIFDYHGANQKSPTLGTLSQNLPEKDSYLNVLAEIREVNIHDRKDEILKEFETFIRKSRFIKLHQDVKEIYNKGEADKAMLLLADESVAINSFSLVNKKHSRVFSDFSKRQVERKQKDFSQIKMATGVPAFDHHTHGGVDIGTSLLAIARKGVGKSTFLRWLGYNFAFRGHTGIHFQGEGPRVDVENAYDSMWTGVGVHDIKKGELGQKDFNKIEQARQQFLANAGEIIVVAYEQFDNANMAECRQIIIDLMKEFDIKWALFDYLEKFNPGDGRRYGTTAESDRIKKLATAEKIVNVATELKIFTGTATQANDIEKKDWDNPNFVITRNNISNLRATIDPFAYCVTLNQTLDENDKDIIRVHEEALRHYRLSSFESTYHIAQRRDLGRFIDIARTNQTFWDPVNKKVIKNTLK
jgi:hypothetical protein